MQCPYRTDCKDCNGRHAKQRPERKDWLSCAIARLHKETGRFSDDIPLTVIKKDETVCDYCKYSVRCNACDYEHECPAERDPEERQYSAELKERIMDYYADHDGIVPWERCIWAVRDEIRAEATGNE